MLSQGHSKQKMNPMHLNLTDKSQGWIEYAGKNEMELGFKTKAAQDEEKQDRL